MTGKKDTMEYAIVDIETTGGYASGNSITEIAILIHNGEQLIDRFETLIRPQHSIPLHIQALTGISDSLVASAPRFAAVAQQVFDLLQGRVFVAHNVNFDYSFIKHELQQAGYSYTAPKLCTVRISRKVRPGLPSYSLGKLCNALSIPISNRHRAGGDAEATATLFTKLLQWDQQDVIREMLRKSSGHQRLPANVSVNQLNNLPHCTGVYYFRDKANRVIYVGKALDIHNRVASHFSGHSPHAQRQHFLRDIHSIAHQPCGTELMALLLEAAEIKHLWPVYNRALKRFEPKFALYAYEDQKGYLHLAIGKYDKRQQCVRIFYHRQEAVNILRSLITDFGLDERYCSFGSTRKPHTAYAPPAPLTHHNQRFKAALATLQGHAANFVITDQGRDTSENSYILVENNNLYGMGYLPANAGQPPVLSEIKAGLTRYQGSQYMMQLIFRYAALHPDKVLQFP